MKPRMYNIADRITIGDNYMIALIDHGIIDYPTLTNLMEWNFTYCFIHRLSQDESKINIYHLNNIEKTKTHRALEGGYDDFIIEFHFYAFYSYIYLVQ